MGKEKENVSPVVVTFNTEVDCERCGRKIKNHIKKFRGVYRVAVYGESNTVKVLGKVVPEVLRQHIKEKVDKEVKIVDVQSAPEDVVAAAVSTRDGILGWLFGFRPSSTDALNQVQLSASTAVLKAEMDCSGCRRVVRKSLRAYGVKLISIDKARGLVTVKGRVDFEKLREYLEGELKHKVEVQSIVGDGDGGGGGGGGGNDGGGVNRRVESRRDSSKKHDVGVKRVNERGESSGGNENRGSSGGDRKKEKDGERKADKKGSSGERRKKEKEKEEEEESHGHGNITDDGEDN